MNSSTVPCGFNDPNPVGLVAILIRAARSVHCVITGQKNVREAALRAQAVVYWLLRTSSDRFSSGTCIKAWQLSSQRLPRKGAGLLE
jgi:hypothetical protein